MIFYNFWAQDDRPPARFWHISAMNVAAGGAQAPVPVPQLIDAATLWTYIGDILYGNDHQHGDSRAPAIQALARHRETLPDLGPILWYSSGIMTVLLSEIVRVYRSTLH